MTRRTKDGDLLNYIHFRAATVSLGMPPPFAECSQEIVDGFLFGPESAQKILRIAGKDDTLLSDQLIDPGCPSRMYFSANGIDEPTIQV